MLLILSRHIFDGLEGVRLPLAVRNQIVIGGLHMVEVSLATLVEETELAKHSIRWCLRRLVELGLIEIRPHPGYPNTYVLQTARILALRH
jgi:DNA-binding IclR family transcriptional regulator